MRIGTHLVSERGPVMSARGSDTGVVQRRLALWIAATPLYELTARSSRGDAGFCAACAGTRGPRRVRRSCGSSGLRRASRPARRRRRTRCTTMSCTAFAGSLGQAHGPLVDHRVHNGPLTGSAAAAGVDACSTHGTGSSAVRAHRARTGWAAGLGRPIGSMSLVRRGTRRPTRCLASRCTSRAATSQDATCIPPPLRRGRGRAIGHRRGGLEPNSRIACGLLAAVVQQRLALPDRLTEELAACWARSPLQVARSSPRGHLWRKHRSVGDRLSSRSAAGMDYREPLRQRMRRDSAGRRRYLDAEFRAARRVDRCRRGRWRRPPARPAPTGTTWTGRTR